MFFSKQNKWRATVLCLSFHSCCLGIFHPKMRILSSFTHSHLISNLNDLLFSAEHKNDILKSVCNQTTSSSNIIIFWSLFLQVPEIISTLRQAGKSSARHEDAPSSLPSNGQTDASYYTTADAATAFAKKFEVLFCGRVVVAHKKAPPALIDECIEKFGRASVTGSFAAGFRRAFSLTQVILFVYLFLYFYSKHELLANMDCFNGMFWFCFECRWQMDRPRGRMEEERDLFFLKEIPAFRLCRLWMRTAFHQSSSDGLLTGPQGSNPPACRKTEPCCSLWVTQSTILTH